MNSAELTPVAEGTVGRIILSSVQALGLSHDRFWNQGHRTGMLCEGKGREGTAFHGPGLVGDAEHPEGQMGCTP